MARIDAAYNYFMTTYGSNIGSRYESHKKSELRDTYNKIVKANKDAPLYKIKDMEDTGQFAIDIKEHANSMSMSCSKLSSAGDSIEDLLKKKIASSSDSESVEAVFVGDDSVNADDFTIDVHSLAQPQTNMGNFLPAEGHNFEEGQYAFDLDIRNHSYEFQYNVNAGETNQTVQQKIIRLINSSDVGLNASLITGSNGDNAIQITSKATGLPEGSTTLFNITSDTSWNELNTLGIDKTIQEPVNSSFTLNGNEHSSMSNTFTVNKAYEVTLKAPTPETVKVGLMKDTEALTDGVSQLLTSYNGMINIGLKYNGVHQNRTLLNEISSIAKGMQSSLEYAGIHIDEMGHLILNESQLSKIINSDDRYEAFTVLNELKAAISRAASKASINPMAYVDKAIVEYKNPGKSLTAPYATSAYSGMLMNYGL